MTTTLAPHLSFRLGSERFALDVFRVREVLEMIAITPVPRAPRHLRGVINVRGSVVPVVDLHDRFGIRQRGAAEDARIVVLEIPHGDDLLVMGLVTDAVEAVLAIDLDSVEAPPAIGTRWDTAHIRGIARSDDEFLVLLDIQQIFAGGELARIDGVQRGEA